MEIIFQPWHLDLAGLNADVAALDKLAETGLVCTIVADTGNDTTILGVAGAVPIKDGQTGEVFILPAKGRLQYPLEFVKSVKRILVWAQKCFSEVEATGDNDHWFRLLGFEPIAVGRWRLI